MGRKTDRDYGNPRPGEPGLNYDSHFAPKPTLGSKKVGARAEQPGSPSHASLAPPAASRAMGGAGKPHHYGERAKTTIVTKGWNGKAASPSGGGMKGPHH